MHSMDICSIVEFRNALCEPSAHFCTLQNIEADTATICRSRHFAECRATIDGRNAIIYAPISPQATRLMHGAIAALRNTASRLYSELTLHACELRRADGEACSVFVEWIAYGRPLSEAIYTSSRTTLLAELEALSTMLVKNNISLNNLKAENIIVDNSGKWHLTHQYYTSANTSNDRIAIEGLRELIERNALADIDTNCLNEAMSEYSASIPMHEHRCKTKENGLIGFIDDRGNKVIECKYLSTTRFVEHRAVVTLPNHRVGVIDIDGNEIITTEYDAIKYDVESGESWAFLGDKATKFDYMGKQLTKWLDIDELDVEVLA